MAVAELKASSNINPLMGTYEVVEGTGRAAAHPGPSSLYQM